MIASRQRCGCRCRRAGSLAGALCAVFFLCAAPCASAQTLDDAYRAELTRLKAEKKALRRALQKAKSRGKKSRTALVSEIESLAKTLTTLRADNTKQEMHVPQAVRMQSMSDQEQSIARRQAQIETWLETHSVALPTSDGPSHDEGSGHQHPPLDVMVVAALDHVKEHGQLWLRSNQEYFGTDGVAKVGPVLHIAEVGAVAVDEGFRPLELASDGSLRLTDQFAPEAVSHGDFRTVGVVLFDPNDIRTIKTEESGWQAWLERGGVVMYAIAALAILALLIFLERILAYLIYVWRVVAAERRGPRAKVPEGNPLLRSVHLIQTGHGSIEALETEAAEAIQGTQAILRRGVSILAVVASVAPLLGLLGTVTGMIGTFGMITEHGTGDPRVLSGGISEALLTTQFGLIVAIPALLFQATLYRCGDAILRRVERFALAVLETKETDVLDEAPRDNVVPVRSVQ